MSTPFLGQITVFGFGFPPKGWAACNGQVLPINQNQALFSLLGTYYGGNGINTFALPNLQGAVAMSFGNGFSQGVSGGEAHHTLSIPETPAHTHAVAVSTAAATALTAPGNFPALATTAAYATGSPNTTLGAGTSSTGSGQPHNNLSPYLALNYCIALTGIFPARN